jgi:hypothetical protein
LACSSTSGVIPVLRAPPLILDIVRLTAVPAQMWSQVPARCAASPGADVEASPGADVQPVPAHTCGQTEHTSPVQWRASQGQGSRVRGRGVECIVGPSWRGGTLRRSMKWYLSLEEHRVQFLMYCAAAPTALSLPAMLSVRNHQYYCHCPLDFCILIGALLVVAVLVPGVSSGMRRSRSSTPGPICSAPTQPSRRIG